MTQKDAKQLFDAVKTDNLASFCALTSEKNLNISFGRFPLLSVCYLYNSKKIIKKFEKQLLGLNEFEYIFEPFELYIKFRTLAGKNIRVYANKTNLIMPLEMLAVLHKDFTLAKKYKNGAKSATTEQNLQKIYELNNQNVKITENKIKISHKKLSHKQKLTLLISNCSLACLILITSLTLLIIANLYGLGTSFSPRKIFNENDLLKLNGKSCYATLLNNLTFDNDYSLDNFSGTLYGNDKTITINSGYSSYLIQKLNGKVENLNVIYTSNIQKTLNGNYGLFVEENNGEINNIKINCALPIKISNETGIITFCGIATTNNKYIHNCEIDFDAEINSSTTADNSASFVTISNYGIISNCNVKETAKLKTINVDVGGMCCVNYADAEISSCENNAEISQSTENDGWSPNVAGISVVNFGSISNSINNGKLNCEHSTQTKANSSIFVGGIVAQNFDLINHCKNNSDISVKSKVISIHAGGITSYSAVQNGSVTKLSGCASITHFDITKEDDTVFAYCGGLAGYMSGSSVYLVGEILDCYSCCEFEQIYSQEKQNMFALMVGASSGQAYFGNINIFLQISNIHCLLSEKSDKPLAIVYTSMGYSYVETLNADITIHSDITEIEQLDIYW